MSRDKSIKTTVRISPRTIAILLKFLEKKGACPRSLSGMIEFYLDSLAQRMLYCEQVKEPMMVDIESAMQFFKHKQTATITVLPNSDKLDDILASLELDFGAENETKCETEN